MLAKSRLRCLIISAGLIGLICPYGHSQEAGAPTSVAELGLQPGAEQENWARPVSLSSDRFTFAAGSAGAVRVIEDEKATVPPPKGEMQAKWGSTAFLFEDLSVPNTAFQDAKDKKFPVDATEGKLPGSRPLPTGFDRTQVVSPIVKQWAPSSICHKPLYFQDTMLERHGHERFPCLQPVASGVRFFGTLPVLPYLMTLHPPQEDIYNLGHYRPGTAAPCLRERPPYDQHALRVQVLSAGAAAVAIP